MGSDMNKADQKEKQQERQGGNEPAGLLRSEPEADQSKSTNADRRNPDRYIFLAFRYGKTDSESKKAYGNREQIIQHHSGRVF